MTLPPEVAASIAENDRVLKQGLLSALLVFMCFVWAFAYWRVDVARTNWFATIAQVDSSGVDVDATITGTRCTPGTSKYVAYRWEFEGKVFSGSGPACENTCFRLSAGDHVKLRFIPARPQLFACLPNDIRRQADAPRFLDVFFHLALVTLVIAVKLIQTYHESPPLD
jgi:hypothetical protein